MKKKKYELIDKVDIVDGHTLYRIRALGNLRYVEKYDLGGWIESEDNLSHDSNCWVYGKAQIFGNAHITEMAWITGNSRVYGNACVERRAWISGNAHVFGDARICGDKCIHMGGNTKLDHGIWTRELVIAGNVYLLSSTLEKFLIEG